MAAATWRKNTFDRWEMMRVKIKIKKIRHLRCGHEWVPRKSDPVFCPYCKGILTEDNTEIIEENGVV